MDRKKRRPPTKAGSEIDLVPIMNMVMCLIPVVLAGSAAVKLGIVDAHAKTWGSAFSQTTEKPLDLTVAVGVDGVRVTATGEDVNGLLTELSGSVVEPLIPLVDGEYDHRALYERVALLKKQFPRETALTLTAGSDVPFKHLVVIMDLLRYELELEADAPLATAKTRHTAHGPAPLFPNIAFAIAQ